MGFDIIKQHDLDEFAQVFFQKYPTSNYSKMLYAKTDPIRSRFEDADKPIQQQLISLLKTYVDTYSFGSLIFTYTDKNLEKLYALAKKIIPG